MFSDQISSTSLTREDAGVNRVQRYTPWGETRTDGGLETDHTYTGQIEDTTTGLRFYNARYMDPVLGRFVSPDTIVPNAGNGQDYNRYSYVENNPVRYSDPTGHDACAGGGGGCGGVRGPGQGIFNVTTGRHDALDANGDGIVCGGGWGGSCEDSWQSPQRREQRNPYQGRTYRGSFREGLFWWFHGAGQDSLWEQALPQGWFSGLYRALDVRSQFHDAGDQFREEPGNRESAETGKSNAVRHGTFAALLAYDLGPDDAWELVDSHEVFIQQDALDTAVDRANNRVGIELGALAREQGLSSDQLKQLVVETYDSGGFFCSDGSGVISC